MTHNVLIYHEHLQNQEAGELITKDNILDLKIALETLKSIDEFLEIFQEKKYIKNKA